MEATVAQIEDLYITIPQIAEECGVTQTTVRNWINYYRYLDREHILGKPAVKRAQYEQFKIDHPELVKAA